MQDVTTGFVVGKGVVEGVRCDHLAFRAPHVDWQIWIQEGKQPLPRKIVITTRDIVNAPQFAVVVTKWNLAPTFDESLFSFKPPKGARKVDFCLSRGRAATRRKPWRPAMKRHMKTCVLAAAAPLLLLAEFSSDAPLGLKLAREAAAIVGAPVTPVSVAGVARRTTRRTVAVAGHQLPRPAAAAAQNSSSRRQRSTAATDRTTAAGGGSAAGRGRPAAGGGRPAAGRGRTAPGDRHRRARIARRLRLGAERGRRVLQVRQHLLPRCVPGQQPRLCGAAAVTRTRAGRPAFRR